MKSLTYCCGWEDGWRNAVPFNGGGSRNETETADAVRPWLCTFDGRLRVQDRAPLQDVAITLEVNGPVYEAITPVKTVKHLTNGTGGFMFMYISHERGVKYTLTVHKDGFEPQSVSGSSPPAGNHVIRLKRVGGDG